jgi:hypothetical protein
LFQGRNGGGTTPGNVWGDDVGFASGIVTPPSLLLHGSHSFYTNANAFLFDVAPNWEKNPIKMATSNHSIDQFLYHFVNLSYVSLIQQQLRV